MATTWTNILNGASTTVGATPGDAVPATALAEVLQISNSGAGIDATLRSVTDGGGDAVPLQVSTSAVMLPSNVVWPYGDSTWFNAGQTGILIPFYVYPNNPYSDATCTRLLGLIRQYRGRVPVIVILNPGSGPGSVMDGNYRAFIKLIQAAGGKVAGYVSTSYSATIDPSRTEEAVKADVDTWLTLYSDTLIDTIFFDEQSYDPGTNNENVDLYKRYTDYCHARNLAPVIANPGTNQREEWFATRTADIIVVAETGAWPSESDMLGAYVGGHIDYKTSLRAALVYGQSSVTSANIRTLAKYVQWIYATDDALSPNPWDSLATHLEDQFAVLAGPNSTDAVLLARANHTGVQAISTVTGLQAALDLKAPLASPSLTGAVTLTTSGASQGITVTYGASLTSANQATFQALGPRNDSNSSGTFAGTVALGGIRTDAAVATNKILGRVGFGGNHTSGGTTNLLYGASVAGVAEGTFNSSSDMPSAVAIYTGSTGQALATANVTLGTERLRVTKDGNVQPGADITYTMGTSTRRWSEVWGGRGSFTKTSTSAEANSTIALFTQSTNSNAALGGYGVRFNHNSSSTAAGVFDIAHGVISGFSGLASGGQGLASWLVAGSPVASSNGWGCFGQEVNPINRSADMGYAKRRGALTRWTGGIQVVPETTDLISGGGEIGNYVTFAYVVSRSSSVNTVTGDYAKSYNGLLIEQDAIAPGGRGVLASGDTSGSAPKLPNYALEIDQRWATGIYTAAGTFTSNRAATFGNAQILAWQDSGGTAQDILQVDSSNNTVLGAKSGQFIKLTPTLTNAVDDTAAAGAGVPVGALYRNGSQVMVRVS